MTRKGTATSRLLSLASVAALIGAASCGGQGDSVVVVHVATGGTVPAVFQLRATLSNADASDLKVFPDLPASTAIGLPTAFSLTLPRGRAGSLDIALDALSAEGDVVANGAAGITIKRGGESEVTITLVAGASLCGNGHVDTGEDCDDGNRISDATCDFRCHLPATGTTDGGAGGGGVFGTGGVGGWGAGGTGSGGVSGTGTGGAGNLDAGSGAGGRPDAGSGSGGITGAGGVSVGGSTGSVGGHGAGGTGAGGIIGTGGNGLGGIIGTGLGGAGGGAGVGAGFGGSGLGGVGGSLTGAGGLGACSTELLTNGTFDAGDVNWTFASPMNSHGIYLSGDPALNGVMFSSPYFLAMLGYGFIDGEETLSQLVYVPPAASRITVQGFVRITTDTSTLICVGCNPGAVEILQGRTVIPVMAWSNQDVNASWTAFATTVDATALRGSTVTFRMRASPNSAPPTRYYFDSMSARVDRCQ
jgi:cysteine-rich repeat protein